MKRENVRQFKLVSGEEILCEIIEWDNDVSEEIIVRNIYNIVSVNNEKTSVRYYTFEPFMCLQTEDSMFQTLNPYHVVVTAIPTNEILDQFESNVKLNKMDINEIENELKKTSSEIKKLLNITDSEPEEIENSKVIKFRPKDTMH